MRVPFSAISALLSITSLANAQTYTACDPTKTSCPADPALGKTITTDFTKGFTDDWTYVNGTEGLVNYNASGANFVITQKNEAPTMVSSKYIFFGKVSATIKASHGTGIVSAFILLSDDLDEIDWEWLGGSNSSVQTNIFRQGNDQGTNLATFANNPDNQEEWHTYTLDWTSSALTWYIDNVAVRTVHYSDFAGTSNKYPQTPMQVRMGNWIGCPDAAAAADPATAGRCAWAGGPADWSQAPYNMQIKEVTIEDYGCASEYVYGDHSGTWQSIQSVGTCDKNAASTTTTSTHSSTTSTHSSTTSTTTEHPSTTSHSTTSVSTTTSPKASDTSKTSDHTSTTKASDTTKPFGEPPATSTTSTKTSYVATSPTHSNAETHPASTPSESPTSTSSTKSSESDTWTVGGSGHDATSGVESYVVSTVTSTYTSIQTPTVQVETNTAGVTETTTASIPEETFTMTTTTTVTSTIELILSPSTTTTSLTTSLSSSSIPANPLTINQTGTGSLPTGTGTPTTFSSSTTSATSTGPASTSASASASAIAKAGDAGQLRSSGVLVSSALTLVFGVFYVLA